MNLFGLIFRTILQLQIINKSLADLLKKAEESGRTVEAKLAGKADTPQNREKMRHIIGIERWGQRRLKTMLGEPPLRDEYEGYQPAATLNMAALRTAFAETRAATVAIARTIQQRGLAETAKANHNDIGDVSLRLWLQYLTTHANFESGFVK
jgi:hypothetical protein